MTAKSNRANFGSKLGVILASAGSAVGLGNIWRFPYEAGNHGGAAFILIYIGCVLFFGIPIMVAEFSIGRHSRSNTARAYQILAPGTPWKWVGRMGVLAGFLILGYYSVVAGWTLDYIVQAATNSFAGQSSESFIASFNNFVQNPWRPVFWTLVFMLMTHFIVVKGVEKDADAFHFASGACSLCRFVAGCRERAQILATAGFQQGGCQCAIGSNGTSLLLAQFRDGVSLHLCVLLPQGRQPA